jgi:hypothetical protein
VVENLLRRLAYGQRLVALVEPDVIKAMPFEEHVSGRDFDLPDDPVDHLAAARTANRGNWHRQSRNNRFPQP